MAGNFSERHKEPRDLACLYLRKNCLSCCCSSLAPCLELPCVLLELLPCLLTGNAAEEGAWPRNLGRMVLIWNSWVAAQINGSYLHVGFMGVWENTALLLPKAWLCQANPVFSLKDSFLRLGQIFLGEEEEE